MKDRVGSLLVVDDLEINRDLLSRRLGRLGYRVQLAENGPQGLEAVKLGDVDLVLLDINMPDMSGLEVLTQIRKHSNPLQMPVIMVTGRTDSKDIVEALNLGANDYITKPIDFPVAIARITTHLSLKWTEESLRASEQRYALAARGANDGLWDWDLIHNEVYFSPRWKSMLGYEDHEIGNRLDEWFERTHRDDIQELRAKIQEHLEGHSEHFEKEHRVIHRDGSYRWMVSRGVAIRHESGGAIRMAGSQRDVTLDRVADPLTGLPNRLLFTDRLGCLLERAKRQGEYLLGVLSLELDHFRKINDSLGRETGGKLLVAIANRMESCLRSADTLTRFGGAHTVARTGSEAFSILLDDIKNESNACRVAERLLQELSPPFGIDGHDISVHPCIGIVLNNSTHAKPEELLQNAETAVNRAKAGAGASYEIFTPAMREQALVRLQLESELCRALERRELELFYQRINSVKTGGIIGFEALMRWRHPTRGIVMPDEFIPLAEETGLIQDIDHWGLRIACQQLRSWQERYAEAASWVMSVNLSARHFLGSDLVDRIVRSLKQTGLNPGNLKLEVTESAIMQNMETSRSLLQQLKNLGIKVALDDFGIGHSSLSYIHRFPVDTLKIDRSFIGSMAGDSESSAIVSAVIALAHNLELDVVAEGVESAEQLEHLNRLGCEFAQGYYFGRPLAKADTESSLADLEPVGKTGFFRGDAAISEANPLVRLCPEAASGAIVEKAPDRFR